MGFTKLGVSQFLIFSDKGVRGGLDPPILADIIWHNKAELVENIPVVKGLDIFVSIWKYTFQGVGQSTNG